MRRWGDAARYPNGAIRALTMPSMDSIMANIADNWSKEFASPSIADRRRGMPKTVSASEAKSQFGSLVEWTVQNKDDVIVESHGRPKAAIISFEEYQRLTALREQARRSEVLAQLETLRERVSARNRDLTEEEAEAIADEITRDTIRRMIAEGKIRYEGQ
jgi:prevent-host-death family protein